AVDTAAFLSELVWLTEQRREVATQLLSEPVDLGVVVFVGPDRISHKAWPQQMAVAGGTAPMGVIESVIDGYYRALDRAIGDLVEVAGPSASVLVVSDHGFGPPSASMFGPNGWLRDAGYLRPRTPRIPTGSRKAIARYVRPAARWWKQRRRLPEGEPMIDWGRSSAYAVTFAHARMFGVVLNRAGVKREGWVDGSEADRLLDQLEEGLGSLTDAGGRRVIRRIHRTAETGPNVLGFPDLLVETDAAFYPSGGLLRASLFEPFDAPAS